MDVSELRRRILRALDDARKEAGARRVEVDAAAAAYATFLEQVAVPLLRQAQSVLRAERQAFAVHTPAGRARLASEASPESYVEIALDTSGAAPQIIGRVSVARGRQGVVVDERPIGSGKPTAELGETDVASFLVEAIPKLVLRP